MRRFPFQAALAAALLCAALAGCATPDYVAADAGVRSDLTSAPR